MSVPRPLRAAQLSFLLSGVSLRNNYKTFNVIHIKKADVSVWP